MAKIAKRTQVKLTDDEKAFRSMVCDNKSELIESKEYFDIGVNGTVLKARITGAGSKAIKFCFNIGGLSTKKKATPSEFFLDYNELDDGFVNQVEEFLGEVVEEEEELDEELITLFGVQQELPAK